MKVDYLYLTRALKTVLIVMLLSVAGTTKGNAEETDPYLLYMLFNDYQVCEQLVPQREWNGIDDIRNFYINDVRFLREFKEVK